MDNSGLGAQTPAPHNGTKLSSLERRVRFGFVLATLALILIGGVTYYSVVHFRQDAALVDHTHQVLNSLTQLLSNLTSAESTQRGYIITGQDDYLRTFRDAVQAVNIQLPHLRQLTADNSVQQKNLDALEPLVAQRLDLLQARLDLRRTQGFEAAQAAIASNSGKNLQANIRALLTTMESEENSLLARREVAAEQSSLLMRAAILSCSLAALLVLGFALFFVRRDFARTRHEEENLRSARDTLEESVRERTTEVAKTGAALRAGEERLARIIDSAMDAILTVDAQQRITIFNPAAEKMFGCPASDAIGSPLERFLPARFRAAHSEHIRAFGENGVTRRTMGGLTPLSGLRTNGEEFPIEASISQSEAGGQKLFTAIVRDVAETAKVREISAKLAAIVESSEDAIISKSLDGLITSWNPAAEKLFGYSASEAVGKHLPAFYPPDRREEELDVLRRIARGEVIAHFESQRLRKDGTCLDVAITMSPLRDNSGRITGASKIVRDITEAKRAEEEIRQHAAMLDLAPALVRDQSNRIILWTVGAEKLYGFPKTYALGKVSHDLLKTEFPRPLPEIQKILESEGVWEGELTHRTLDGSRVVVASQWLVYRDAKGRPSRILEVNTDISALKRAETLQLRSQKLEALGTLAGGIAHDFNNILSAINGAAALAVSQFPADHPIQACLMEIERAGQRAAELVRRILSFSRPQEQNLRVQDLQPIVEESLKLVRATLPAMTEIRSTYAANLPNARVDSTQICQVILNLATNASHAIGDKPGVIELKLDAVHILPNETHLYSEIPAGHYLRLSVTDNGCGMNPATLDRIFDPFFTTKPVGKGTGLGLSVVHGIIHSHGGLLRVYSELEKGTAFQIYFPAAPEAAAPVPASDFAAPPGHGEHILFVDDEGVLVFVGTMLLEQKGYRVTGVAGADAALREFQDNPDAFDAVITDLSMPTMSGLQFARELQKIRPDIPILLTSGYFDPHDQRNAAQQGIRATLTKPVNPRELLAVLYSIFQARPRPGKSHSA